LIDWLKANPNKASAGIVSTGANLLTKFFQKETGTKFTLVPYRGVAPAVQDLVAGQLDLLLTPPDALMRAGSIKAYAVTRDTRLTLAPDVPTFGEMGLPTVAYSGWFALIAPKGTSRDIIGKLNVSGAVFDLSAGPVTISLPNAGNRYMSMQVMGRGPLHARGGIRRRQLHLFSGKG
jgi:tripartite-type tricarboxylate transporter receptor subunit TctC